MYLGGASVLVFCWELKLQVDTEYQLATLMKMKQFHRHVLIGLALV